MKFMNLSTANLVKNLDPANFYILKKEFSEKIQQDLLTRKGEYPYDYKDFINRFNQTSLPPMTTFYSKLSGKQITKEDYEHAKKGLASLWL